jgi:hypothetical protein
MTIRSFNRSAAITLMAFLLTMALLSTSAGAPPDKKETESKPKYIAYYFFTNKRCGPCTRIEQWSREAVTANFKNELSSGKLQWQGVNLQQAENKHFIQDFQLYSKSVIIAEYKDDKPVRWENLKDVWQLYRDRDKYFDYVADEIKTFMEKK